MKNIIQMEAKKFFIPFLVLLAVFTAGFALAGETGDLTYNVVTEINGIEVSPWYPTVAGFAGNNVPVRVTFEALKDAQDVKVKVWMEGYRDDVSASTGRFDLVDGSTYTKLLNLEFPSDLKDTTKDYTLHVSISNADNYDFEEYQVKMQRESYDFDVLSVDFDARVAAGDVVPVAIVIENTGMQELEDGYVTVTIPELGASAKGYFGDLVATEECRLYEQDYDSIVMENCNNDDTDSLQRIVYLRIPENAEAGVYELSVKVYNKDASTTVNELIKVEGSSLTQVLAGVKNQDIKAGETKTYDLIIVNTGDKVKVYNIQVVSGTALSVSAPSVVTVGSDSSQTVQITVTANSNADVGTYTFSVDVNGEQVVFGANVTGKAEVSNSVVALTVALVIIFVVLLIVLLVLLTRKEKPINEVETSYY